MKRWTILIIVFLVLVIGGIALVKLRWHQLQSIRIETKLPVPVDTARVKKGVFKKWMLYIGTLESNKQAMVRGRIQGQVTKILKREGDFVKKGDKIIELDGIEGSSFGTRKALEKSIQDQKKAIADMEKTVANLKNIYERDLNLYQNKAISKQALEVSENRLKAGEIQLSNLKKGLYNLQDKFSFYSVRAPFSGVITKVMVNEGDVIMPSMPLVQLENKNACKLVVTVASDDIPKIKVGREAKVLYNNQELDAEIARVYPSARGLGVGSVEIDFSEHPFNLPLGSKLSVEIPVEVIQDALLVPDGAVLTSAYTNTVFRIVNKKVEPINVKVLGASANSYAVEGNLHEGDLVVVGSDSLLMRLEKGTEVLLGKGE
ncbi:RND family efflux pump membrane fusion protein [Thermotomaculum hydrothermale]|uniref:RND family efflux pump membrane fusion protein n=1 Tax=Thermotomaculum hydrothermale TaxID=981385 RepID=A0A7R6PQQ3_9BACT|nr:efflux RND transporter periplasmic adaptor subunit [Thermotomaculum hydrothermale]BBB32606.1 RND family efflux pump membrane fusion protein [Thermotomaculum hydrothermale]